MPQRGNRSRPDTDRLATVFGLVLAIAMVSTVAVPGLALALADVNVLSGPPGGGQGGNGGDDNCKTDSAAWLSSSSLVPTAWVTVTACLSQPLPAGSHQGQCQLGEGGLSVDMEAGMPSAPDEYDWNWDLIITDGRGQTDEGSGKVVNEEHTWPTEDPKYVDQGWSVHAHGQILNRGVLPEGAEATVSRTC